ncbi:tyrosine-type recombinase/integrase [Bosea sp. BIWAKO-01]|uniref:tyrosine-type recombinase/integrase n=1 Tax=Bosea sp. BIWAKO-01 TaxID=506668 RepID=UPI000852EF56|nr:tyrosine-type recombinase/integrase [Bosea sp. BIWAKO-01]GAU84215.1 hypothetical protein BIWAKO_04147 [Bosea sp. BIWAKO-01]
MAMAASRQAVRTVFVVSQEAIKEGIPPGLEGAPFIVNETGEFDERLNEYLWARRNGDWSPATPVPGRDLEVYGREVLRAQLNYLRSRAYQLDVLRRWLLLEGLDYREVDQATLELYGDDLEAGLTSKKQGLQPSSVNQYLLSAIDFLNFGSQRGWRGRLVLERSKKGRRFRRSRRSGDKGELLVMRRCNPEQIEVWYDEKEIDAFCGEFETAPGTLAARLIHRMGLRIAEVLALTVRSFPSLEEFHKDRARRFVTVTGKFGKSRPVPIDESIVRAVERFKEFDRKFYEARLATPTDALLIGDSIEGTAPMQPRYLQKQFARARHAAGYSALSPHVLRHHFAAHFLLREWKQKARILSMHPHAFNISSGEAILSAELLRLQSALGHESIETTVKYLRGVAYLMGSEIPQQYSDELDGEAA